MRDRQARGKDPFGASSKDPFPSGDFQHRQGGGRGGSGGRRHSDSEGDDDENTGFIGGTGPGSGGASERQRGETFEAFRRREWARDVLESPEMLMWYASSREDSIPGTRLFFTRVLCGFEEDHVPPQESTQRKSSGSGPGRPHGHKRR
ncbi:hypothetical protein HYQ45_017931 [Verticillium longisporum]|uniref:Uncharacterized protein n=1 Tax=Verticillium longisporum TaxID=100787 RepID=A0A8I3AHU3_VERLO|nr:hypothetical protein HYQ45_017931 [Verticillium longisporum]